MQVAVLRAFRHPLALEDWPTPEAEGDEVVVRVLSAGVCHSDVHMADGDLPSLPLPLVLGHEIAGYAEGFGNVLVFASWGCGDCELCRRGDEQLCLEAREPGWARQGGYAEYVVVPSARHLLPLGELDPIRAAPLADAGVTPYRAVRRFRHMLRDGDTAVVIGIGGLGQFALQFLKLLTKARVVALDRSAAKLTRATSLGADEAISTTGFKGLARIVFDFVGSEDTLRFASGIVERGGAVVQVGEAGGRIPFGLGAVPHEAILTTSIWGSMDDLKAVLEFARAGKIRWHIECLPLRDVNDALDRVRRGDVSGRLVLRP